MVQSIGPATGFQWSLLVFFFGFWFFIFPCLHIFTFKTWAVSLSSFDGFSSLKHIFLDSIKDAVHFIMEKKNIVLILLGMMLTIVKS